MKKIIIRHLQKSIGVLQLVLQLYDYEDQTWAYSLLNLVHVHLDLVLLHQEVWVVCEGKLSNWVIHSLAMLAAMEYLQLCIEDYKIWFSGYRRKEE